MAVKAMLDEKNTPTFIMPHRTRVVMGDLLDIARELKGAKSWTEFDLECMIAKFPKDTRLPKALKELQDRTGEKEATKAAQVAADAKKKADEKVAAAKKAKKEKEAADKKAKAEKEAADKKAKADAKGNGKKAPGKKVKPPGPPAGNKGTSTKGKKTAAQMAADKGKGSPATEQSPEETAGELADIK